MNSSKRTARKRRYLLLKGIGESNTFLGRWARRIFLQGRFTPQQLKDLRNRAAKESQ